MKHAEILCRYRKMKDLTQSELAKHLDVEQGAISKIELGKAYLTVWNLWQIVEESLGIALASELNRKLPKMGPRKKSSRLI